MGKRGGVEGRRMGEKDLKYIRYRYKFPMTNVVNAYDKYILTDNKVRKKKSK